MQRDVGDVTGADVHRRRAAPVEEQRMLGVPPGRRIGHFVGHTRRGSPVNRPVASTGAIHACASLYAVRVPPVRTDCAGGLRTAHLWAALSVRAAEQHRSFRREGHVSGPAGEVALAHSAVGRAERLVGGQSARREPEHRGRYGHHHWAAGRTISWLSGHRHLDTCHERATASHLLRAVHRTRQGPIGAATKSGSRWAAARGPRSSPYLLPSAYSLTCALTGSARIASTTRDQNRS